MSTDHMSVDFITLGHKGNDMMVAMRLYRAGHKPAHAVLPLVLEQIRGYAALAGELCSDQQSPEAQVGACRPAGQQHHPEIHAQIQDDDDGYPD